MFCFCFVFLPFLPFNLKFPGSLPLIVLLPPSQQLGL
jgi:hypothetical protein